MRPRLYIQDESFLMPKTFLPEELYSQVLDSLVVVCADVAIIDSSRKTFWLAKRLAKPLPGFWIIGGRISAGEKEDDAVSRLFERETTLPIMKDRFMYISMNRYICSERKQIPQDKGSDTLGYTFVVELTPEERAIVARNLDTAEYEGQEGLREFSREEMIEERVHPAVIDLYDLCFS